MNKWIEGKADPAQPNARAEDSKLPVLPPELEKTPAQPANSNGESPGEIPVARPIALETDLKIQYDVLSPQDAFVFDPLDPNLAFPLDGKQVGRELTKSPLQPVFKKRKLSKFAFFYGLPSWLSSFVFHLALILVLALFSFVVKDGANIELVLDQPAAATNMDFMEVAVEVDAESDLEEQQELESSSKEELLAELESTFHSELQANVADYSATNDSMEGSDTGFKFQRGDGISASFFGVGAQGTKFVFVVDRSGSMEDNYRWTMAKRELKEAILGLTEDQEFYVFLYSEKTMGFRAGKGPKLMKASPDNKADVFKWLDGHQPEGDTRPWKSVRLSLRLRPDAIFFLSDGELRDDTVIRLRKTNKEKTVRGEKIGKIPLHTVSLGRGFGAQTMKLIADENEGTFTRVNDW